MESYWHWFCCALPGNPSLQQAVLRRYGTPKAIFDADQGEMVEYFYRNRRKITNMCGSRKLWDFEKERAALERQGIRFLSCVHPDFPEKLKGLSDIPCGLFVRGRLPKQGALSVALVGARECSVYGKNVALWFGRELAKSGVQIISGMARGIDGYGQWGALKGKGASFAVLGNGVDICYPPENGKLYQCLIQEGGVISECPPGMPPGRHLFPLRNRIISGLADAVLIIEAKEKSGSLITADLALEQGRDVYAVPGRLGDELSKGCHNLIRQGAGLALSPEKLLEDLQWLPKINIQEEEKNKIALESSENMVYSCLSLQALNLEEIMTRTKLPVQEVLRTLTGLELKGYIQEISKNYYARAF